jgi:5-methyltetrahydropteroyltriglutamate--homocysteine methyltransferase
MPSATPSRADVDTDQIYPTESAYLYALADAMHEEYKAIVDAGFIVQLDLGLPARNQVLPDNPNPSWAELRRASEMQIEAANPRHEHEWMIWKDVKLPDGKILIPGVVSHQTNVVEHPELVAMRIKNYASVVGRENVIASTDCGFAQGWSMIRVHPEVQWAKLGTLVEGAQLASRDLWK